MRYFAAAILGLAIAASAGVSTGLHAARAASDLGPLDRATAYSAGIATGINCAAFLALVLVPLALVVAWIRRPRSRTTR